MQDLDEICRKLFILGFILTCRVISRTREAQTVVTPFNRIDRGLYYFEGITRKQNCFEEMVNNNQMKLDLAADED